MNNEQDTDNGGGSFVTGIVLGTLVGVAGMFMFGTKKGKKTVARVQKKWQEFEPALEQGIEQTQDGLKKSKRPFFQAVSEIVDYVADHLETQKPKTKSAAKAAPATKKKQFFKK